MKIDKKLQLNGQFWLPETPQQVVGGVLYVAETGRISADLYGELESGIDALKAGGNYPQLLGNVEKYGWVTLRDCMCRSKTIATNSISTSLIDARLLIAGAHYETDEPLLFRAVEIELDGIDQWLGISGISVNHPSDESPTTITYTPPKADRHVLNEGTYIEFTYRWQLPFSPALTEAKITQSASIVFNSSRPSPFEDFQGMIYEFSNFLSFATDEIVNLRSIKAMEILRNDDSQNLKRTTPLIIWYESLPYNSKPGATAFHNILFRYKQIDVRFAELYGNWHNAYERFGPAISLYFSSRAGDHKYINGRFLSLIQGLETFHRRTSNETIMDSACFKDLSKAIIDACPEGHKKWLADRLRFGNEISLAKRLRRITEPFSNLYKSVFNIQKFIRLVVDTRNYFTHYTPELESKASQGVELLNLCTRMEVFFQLHLMRELGFTLGEIETLAQSSDELKRRINGTNCCSRFGA